MFADDTAMVVEDFRRDLPRIYEIFKELAAAAHLQLNYNMCVFIPLFEYDKRQVQADLRGAADPLGANIIAALSVFSISQWHRPDNRYVGLGLASNP